MCLLIAQLLPVYPATQAQEKESTPSVHVPPFSQGSGEQLSISEARIALFYIMVYEYVMNIILVSSLGFLNSII